MKTNYPKTIAEHLNQKYGESGSKAREDFEERSQSYMIAELVKGARTEAGLTQEELANRLNVKRTYISKIERAVSDVRVSTLRKIVEEGLGGKLHISVEW